MRRRIERGGRRKRRGRRRCGRRRMRRMGGRRRSSRRRRRNSGRWKSSRRKTRIIQMGGLKLCEVGKYGRRCILTPGIFQTFDGGWLEQRDDLNP